MGQCKELLLFVEQEAHEAEWKASSEGLSWRRKQEEERASDVAAQARKERVWAINFPTEWEEWNRVRFSLNLIINFGAEHPFDFDDFLREVGRRRSLRRRIGRCNKALPYQQGNLRWYSKPLKQPKSPYLDAKQAAAYLGIEIQTLYNNRKHIPSLPGFKTLMFDPKVLEEVRGSLKFRKNRLTEQRRQRSRSANS